ncbi:ACP S-malonyltransferase [Cellulomonas chengniuliangii]|uniref:ACP S-malonyltransferase n=1 Tax=Cellulomonas chengniuliangii TaxID=2968084 RepID=UPI001D0E55E6|nr:ACP S-malonyltransferase [Cellulomonas chengniuliangii]MCC2318297.1 ACP S-malonyltransferase [Cellulomonas chengniuliangii]
MLAIVCPGQGSQTPGMLAPWLDVAGVPGRVAAFSEASGLDLRSHGVDSDAEAIRDTAVAQPLIVAMSLIALRAILDGQDAAQVAGATAGHSVGELAAAAVAGVLTDEDAVSLVTVRASLMAQAAAAEPTGMSAVVGGDPEQVLAAIAQAGLWPANVNGGGQVVAAGSLEGLAALAAEPPARARVIPLQVAGAFHTPFMQSALDGFAPVAAARPADDPRMVLLSDADGAAYGDLPGEHGRFGAAADVLDRIAQQIVAPVRWDLCQETLLRVGVTGLLELAPGGVLTGLARRTLPGVETVAVKSPTDIQAARDLIARHAAPLSQETPS